MLDKIRNYIKENHMLRKGDGVVIGLSGGADSVCLLKALHALRDEYDLSLYCVHINHGIRDAEAERDRDFAEAVSQKYGAKFFDFSFDIPALSESEGLGIEETGRKYRYQAFEEIRQKTGSSKTAVAHNKNDNAETILQRLLRGTGLKGLGGISPVRGSIIRPLLCVSREEIEKFLDGEKYVTDSTNLSEEYVRNKIRLSLIPYLEREFNPGLIDGLFRASQLIGSENDYLEREGERAYKRALIEESEKKAVLDAGLLSEEDEVIIRRALRRACIPLTEKKQDIEFRHIEYLQKLLESTEGKEINLSSGLKAERRGEKLFIVRYDGKSKYEYKYEIFPEKETFIREAGIKILLTEKKRSLREYGRLDPLGISPPLMARNAAAGDKIAIKGGRQQIKKIFSQYRIPVSERASYPILEDNSRIYALTGLKKAYGLLDFKGDNGYYLYVLS